MCGFVGFSLRRTTPQNATEIVKKMLLAVAHRGPEGQFAIVWNGFALGHCKLSFTDHVLGCQPMVSSNRRFAIVFNGEIYNFRAWRRRLAREGRVCETQSDTEVVLAIYERYGLDGLNQLRGMFALAICDAAADEVILARDPFGKKPLYYFVGSEGIVFASELSAVLRHPDSPHSINSSTLADYLMLRACPAPESIINGIRKVPAGGVIRFRNDTRALSHSCLMSPIASGAHLEQRQRPQVSEERVTRQFGELLRRAVVRRLSTTNNEFGVLLSGGIDSAIVAALAVRATRRKLKTFSIGFEDDRIHDETRYACAVSNHLGTDHYAIKLPAAGLSDVVSRAYGQLDEPLADPSFLPAYLVCAEARRYVRGVLTGDGADEFLLGYRFFQVERILGFVERFYGTLSDRFPRRFAYLRNVHATDHSRKDILSILARGLQGDADTRFYLAHAPFAWEELKDALTPDVWNELANHVPFRELRRFLISRNEQNRLRRAQLGVIFHFLQDVILTKVDRASMLHALEARCPFLDVDLTDFVETLPLSMKLRWLTSKYILRRLAEGYLPREIVYRTKHGFWTPIRSLLSRELKALAQDTLAVAELEKQRLFDPRFVQLIMKQHFSQERDHSAKIWSLLCFQLWLKGQATPRF